MPDETEKPREVPHLEDSDRTEPGDGHLEDEENERPTVSPPFDPVVFARNVLKPSPTPMRAIVRSSTDLHTHATPAQGTVARQAAAAATRATRLTPASRKETPASTLSLVNTRIPSTLPPRPTALPDGSSRANEAESTPPQADLELPTRPAPADVPGGDPHIEIARARPPKLALDDLGFEKDDEHAVDTVRRPVVQEPLKSREQEMNDRVELGDYSGALEIAQKILADKPDDLGARATAETCRSVLRQMYAARIGPLERVPVVMVPRDQLRWLSIDHRAGFVLSLVDGVSSLEMILDVSGMPELDTLRILSELAQQRIISLR